jgi:hypothetical protein
MKQITLLEPELEVIIEALQDLRERYARDDARRDDVMMVTAVDDVLAKLGEAEDVAEPR